MTTDQIENLANKFLDVAKSKKNSGFVWKLVLWAVGLLVVGLMLYGVFRKNRELAKLQHEKNVAEEKRRLAEAAKQVALHNEEIKQLEADIASLDTQILNQKMLVAVRAQETKRFEEKLANVKNWKELDKAFRD